MAKQSAGILLYRQRPGRPVEVLLAHPGGPYWARKDKAAWSLPKGEFEDGEEPLSAAKREFSEETGMKLGEADFTELGTVKMSSGKVIYAWALEGDFDVTKLASNTFSMEWPPKSGQQEKFPEVDRAAWFTLPEAAMRLHPSQVAFLERMAEKLGFQFKPPEQATLF